MRISAAQINSKVWEIDENLQTHYRMIALAAQNQASIIIFPEMSITGYCRAEGKELAFVKKDERLHKLRSLSKQHNLMVVAGAPIAIKDKLFIGAYVIKPSGEMEIYTKQFLDKSEIDFYDASFDYDPIIEVAGEKILLAICADIDNALHPENAGKRNCTIYLPSIFFTKEGIDHGHELLSNYAQKHSFAVLMSNYCGMNWDLESGGRSALWNKDGRIVAALDAGNEGLLLAERSNGGWLTKILPA